MRSCFKPKCSKVLNRSCEPAQCVSASPASAADNDRAQQRAYSTVRPAAKESNLAPILLGLGLVGSAGFFYSTSGQRNLQTESLVEKVKNAVTVSALSPDEFRAFKLAKVEPYNHNTSRFIFELPEGSNSGLVITSALVTKSATEGLALAKNGKPAIRPYTPVTAPNTQGTLELLVKNYAGGVMSSHIHELKVGESLQMKGPIHKFPYGQSNHHYDVETRWRLCESSRHTLMRNRSRQRIQGDRSDRWR